MLRTRIDRMQYLRRLPLRKLVWLLAAVGFTFSTLGFVVDLRRVTSLTPKITVLAVAIVSGLVSCMYVLGVVRSRAWIVLGVVAQFALIFAVDRFLPAGSAPGPGGPAIEAIRGQAIFDAMGCLFAAVAGYVLFIGFISREGLRQVQLDTEIGLARDIHARLVPEFERRVSNFELLGRSVPSSEVGGDMVDVFETRDGLLGIVADVSGHGVPAGILMAMVRAAVRTSGANQATLEELFARVDQLLVDLDRPDKFATAACLRLHPDGTAEALLAGHLPILVVRAGAHSVERIENGRPPLGIPVPSLSTRTHYRPGDLFAVITDGLTEVADGGGHMLGLEPIEALIVDRANAPLREIADAVFDRCRRHGPINDDQTLLLVRAS